MSKELTELGQELRTEFDHRRDILQKLGMEIHHDIKDQFQDFRRHELTDASSRSRSTLQLQTDVKALMTNFSQEENTLKQSLRENQDNQTRELTQWIKDSRKQLNAWQKAVRYIRTGM